MAHTTIDIAADAVAIQAGAVVSKVVYRDEEIDVTVFGFDAGEGLTEHTAARPAIIQVLTGRLLFTVEGDERQVVPGAWLHMSPGTPHSLVAEEATIMLLTLLHARA
jgi:quercetin dioxygenase-like cupin family protein